MTELKARERMKIPRQAMPTQTAEERSANFNEVALGFTLETAQREADRCLQCPHPECVEGCPVGVQIPQFIRALRDGDMVGAVRAMKEKNNLPAICGRVCPQESQCEANCVVGRRRDPVAIGRLERVVGDWELANHSSPPTRVPSTGKRAAIVGSGPAGLTCAVDLARQGHDVTIYESLHNPGGVLVYGIPEFRLPKKVIAAEIDVAAQHLGIQIRTDHVIGRTLTLSDLLEGNDAIFLGTGAGLPSFMRIPGINYNGVFSANEFLTRVNLMKGYLFPKYDTPVKVGRKVVVIGAGNVAMDSARSSLRLQRLNAQPEDEPGEVHIVYRRSAEEVPARAEEVHHAHEEGVIFDFLTNPIEILGDERDNVRAMRCIRMELGEPDDSGRRRPLPIEGSEFEMAVDEVIMALGTSPNPVVFEEAEGLARSRWGTVVVEDHQTGRTSMPQVWAGGDVVTGAATVISAMGAGKVAAADMNAFLSNGSDKASFWPSA